MRAEENPRIQRVRFALRATGAVPDADNRLRAGIHTRGYLPHVKREGASYFLTFRLADSLPRQILLKFESERAQKMQGLYARHGSEKKPGGAPLKLTESIEQIERDFRRRLERFLDTGCGACWLARADVADLVAKALRFFEGRRYRLDAWAIMPNHVHAVLWPMPNETLSGIVQSWKRYTAREANKVLNRTGETFWQPESYDHWIRDPDEHARCCHYVTFNPVQAGLCMAPENWPWSSATSRNADL